MSDDDISRKDVVSNVGQSDRRRFVSGVATAVVAGAGVAAGSGGVSADQYAPVAARDAEAVFEEHAGVLLERLSEEGVLASASTDELTTDAVRGNRDDVGVARFRNDGEDVYTLRQETDGGQLHLQAKPGTGEALAVLDTDDGLRFVTEDGLRARGDVEPAGCGCKITWDCWLGELYCNGESMISCC